MPVLHLFVNPIADEPGFPGAKPSDWNDVHDVNIVNADVDLAAGIVESKLSLNFPTHALVTLGTPNGLVLAGQVLSMGLAGTNSTGTITAADWNLFNSKQSALTFPLAANLGGTGINNSGTFTNQSNTTIIGGGTISLGGFTLTVPATGTAALLATANVFTAVQQVTVATTSAKGLILKTSDNNTTNPLLEIQSSSAGQLMTIGATGTLGVGTVATATKAVDVFMGVGSTTSINGLNFIVRKTAGGTSGNIIGFNGTAQVITNSAAGTTVTVLAAGSVSLSINGTATNSRTATVTSEAVGFLISEPALVAPISLPGNALEGININNQGNALIGTSYALRIRGQSGSTTNNYSIYSDAGLWRVGDAMTITGVQDLNQLKVAGFTTQTLPVGYLIDNTSTTNAVRNVLQLETQSTGTAAAGLGAGLLFSIETATASTMQNAGRVYSEWVVATNATRTAKTSLTAFDYGAERIGFQVEGSGTATKVSLFGVATITRPTNAIAAAAFVTNTSLIFDDSATWGGYTIGQIAQALINIGILT